MLPAYYIDKQRPYVLIDGKRKAASYQKTDVKETGSFGEGRVRLKVIEEELGRPTKAERVQRINRKAFKYVVEVTADRDLKFCYGILPYLVSGNAMLFYKTIGTLRRGESKRLTIETSEFVETVGAFHVFSEGNEIRNDQIEVYSIREETKRLNKAPTDVSVIRLTDTERYHPHLLSPDGTRLATFRDRGTHTSLIVLDLESMRLVKEVRIGKHSDWIYGLDWISAAEAIFVLAPGNEEEVFDPSVRRADRDYNLYRYRLGDEKAEEDQGFREGYNNLDREVNLRVTARLRGKHW